VIEREFTVQHNGDEYFVDIPYQFAVSTSVSLTPSGHDGRGTCDPTFTPWGNGSGFASAKAARLLDVFTAGDTVYLLAYTALVDGAGAFCDPDFCFIQPATGQVATPAGFAAVDFPHTGYVIRSNPAHQPQQEFRSMVDRTYGLETIRIVFDAAREDRDYRLKDMWRTTGVVPVWQSFGDRRFLDSVDDNRYERHEGIPKYREVTIYDANGIALRFWGERQEDESWRYHGLQGVFSELRENRNRPGEFYLLGGPPGAMHAKGSWLYIFNQIESVEGRFSGLGAKLRLLVDPAGNLIAINHPPRNSTEPTTLAYQPVDAVTPLKVMRRHSNGELDYNSRPGEWQPFGVVGTNFVEWGDLSVRWLDDGAWIGNRWEYWTTRLFDIREAMPFMRHPATTPSGSDGQRLHTRRVGNLQPTTYDYGWHDINGNPSRTLFTITAQQTGKRPKWLTYKVRLYENDPLRKEFEEAQLLRPSLSNATVYDRTLYHFDANGQIDWVRFFSTRGDTQPRWEIDISYNPNNPALVNSITFTDVASHRSLTTQYNWKAVPIAPFNWQGQTIERGVEWVLGGVQDPTGVYVELRYPHEVDDAGEAPPVAPVRIRDGTGYETRLDYHSDGRLKQLWEPGHTNPWRIDYYPDSIQPRDSCYRGKRRPWKITDPTGREVEITCYDAFGRPTRWEVRPNETTTLWQEVEWNRLGLPTVVQWSDRSSIELSWLQGNLSGVRDAEGRYASFAYNHPLGGHLLSEIYVGGRLFAQLDYDDYGRLKRVQGGNGIGVSYGYDDPAANDAVGERDVLRWVRNDGDPAPERFTYRCCGELERWTKPDGRWARFDYEAGLPTQITTSGGQLYTYRYDNAGRLKLAQNSVSQSSWVYEYEIGTNTGPASQRDRLLALGSRR
jgi:YD repeat-containing protein